MNNRNKFGLLGKDISYSFSRKYFTEKFQELGLKDYKYSNIDIPEIEEFPFLLYHREDAVNTIKITDDNKLVGYNTDFYGFQNAIQPLLKSNHKKALILGTGGASKAIAYAFDKMNIEYKFVSRKVSEGRFLYSMLNEQIMKEYTVIVNSSPVGTHPNINESPNIPFQFITNKHLLFDLIYNPAETKFLSEGKKRGAIIKNGLEMLQLQAEKSWKIWNS